MKEKLKIIFWGNGDRAVPCLKALLEKGYVPDLVVLHPQLESQWNARIEEEAAKYRLPVAAPEDPNAMSFEQELLKRKADLFVLAGYGKLLKPNIFNLPLKMCINLHGGKLPEYRGSSPMNWALINGEKTFTLSVVQVVSKVDGGDLLLERTFPIKPHETIRELHHKAGEEFPAMLIQVVDQIAEGTARPKPQDESRAGYYPLRFPDDGFILWDSLSAQQIHNRIRALTEPYPCAFTFFGGRKIRLLASELKAPAYFGEPGRIYRKTEEGILVCAQDQCLWIKEAVFADTGQSFFASVKRYDRLPTLKQVALLALEGKIPQLFAANF